MSEQPPTPPDPTDPSGQQPPPPPPPPAQPYGQPAQPYGQPAQPQYGQPQYGQPPYGQPQPPYGQYPPQPGYGYSYQAPPPTPSNASTALILGIIGLVMCPLTTIPAWVIGKKAVREIDESNGQLGGRSTANAGYILGIVGTAIWALGILLIVVLFALGAAFRDDIANDLCNDLNQDGTYAVDC